MSFRHRYLRSLLAVDPVMTGHSGKRHHQGYPWWRRYLAALFDITLPPHPKADQRLAPSVNSQNASSELSPRQAGPARRVPIRAQTVPSSHYRTASRRTEWLPFAVVCGGLVLLAAFGYGSFQGWGNQSAGQPAGVGAPTPSPTPVSTGDTAEPPPGGTVVAAPPSPTPTAGGLGWRGTLVLTNGYGEAGWFFERLPPYQLQGLPPDLGVDCAVNCASDAVVVSDFAIAAWAGQGPPSEDQCSADLANSQVLSDVHVGSMGCFLTRSVQVGYFKVVAVTAQTMTVQVNLWAAE